MYDLLLIDTAGDPLIDIMTEDFGLGTLPLSGVLIGGPESIAAAGGAIPTFITPLGFDATHVLPPLDSLMEPSLSDGAIKRTYTEIDIGLLRDLGYSIKRSRSQAWHFRCYLHCQ